MNSSSNLQELSNKIFLAGSTEINLIFYFAFKEILAYQYLYKLIQMQNSKENYDPFIYCHPNTPLFSNWIICPQNLYIPHNSNLFFYPSTLFPDTNLSNTTLFFSFPLINQYNTANTYLQNETDQKFLEQVQNHPSNPSKNVQSRDVPIKPLQRRSRKKNELQNIKDWEKDRNILSNSLKLFFKHLRSNLKVQGNYQQKIIKTASLKISLQQFERRFNEVFPLDQNYIRPYQVRCIIAEQSKQFSLILKISLRKFFKESIYLLCSKSTQTKRSIRRQQIIAGRKLLEYFYGEPEETQESNQ